MEGMRQLLRGALGKSLGALSPEDRLAAAWPVACGRAMADRGELLAFADGFLTIRAADAVWLRQMQSMQAQLTADLRRIAAVDLREIHFETGADQLRPRSISQQPPKAGRAPAAPRSRRNAPPR